MLAGLLVGEFIQKEQSRPYAMLTVRKHAYGVDRTWVGLGFLDLARQVAVAYVEEDTKFESVKDGEPTSRQDKSLAYYLLMEAYVHEDTLGRCRYSSPTSDMSKTMAVIGVA